MKKILIVAPDFPYPPNHGGRVEIWGRIKSLVNIGYNVDLIVTVKSTPCEDDIIETKKYVNNIIFCKRENRIWDMFSLLPLQAISRKSLRSADLHNEYDIVLLEGEYVCGILDNPSLKAKHVVLRVHNNEQIYFRELAGSVGFGICLYVQLKKI